MQRHQPYYWKAGLEFLKQDSKMHQLIQKFQNESLYINNSFLETAINSVIGQQISVKAAASIKKKFSAKTQFSPEKIMQMDITKLRQIGLSRSKIEYVFNIVEFNNQHHITWKNFHTIEKDFLNVKGVGLWTLNMVQVFYAQNPNVFPTKDLGLIKACKNHYPNHSFDELKKRFSPFCTMATWYLWRSIDPEPVNY